MSAAMGHWFSAAELLADPADARLFANGSFATIYLSPRDYHRVHMPLAGRPRALRYVPGKLFSVNQVTAESVPGLFARNERLPACSIPSTVRWRWCWSGRWWSRVSRPCGPAR